MNWLVPVVVCLLATVVEGMPKREVEEVVGQEDTVIVKCKEEMMIIAVKRDLFEYFLNGTERICESLYFTLKEYYPTKRDSPVFQWELPMTQSSVGPCGMTYGQLPDSQLWAHSVTVYGPDKERTARCTNAGKLDRSGAHIRFRQVTPELKELAPNKEGYVDIPRKSTVTASFEHSFHPDADISLHPIQCWLLNERKGTRKLVLDAGCPLFIRPDETIVSLGADTASNVTSDQPYLMFNAEPPLFEDEDPFDLPPFKLQCSVMPCKGSPLYQQIIGVGRCPSIAWCQDPKMKLLYEPEDAFLITHDFDLRISSSSSIPEKAYHQLGKPVLIAVADYCEKGGDGCEDEDDGDLLTEL